MTPLEIKRKLRGSGRKATQQRLSILQAVEGMQACFTPRQLYEYLHKERPEIGLVTVYRTLKLLADSGLVCRMGRRGNAQSYAGRPREHHHHLICTGCNKVVDIPGCALGELEKELAHDTGFAISDHHLEFVGLCRDCQKAAGDLP